VHASDVGKQGTTIETGKKRDWSKTMAIRFLCFVCGHRLKAATGLAGKRAKCTRCSHVVVVPMVEAALVPPVRTSASEVFCFGIGGVSGAGHLAQTISRLARAKSTEAARKPRSIVAAAAFAQASPIGQVKP
jgi:hypothetical protein